MRVYIHCNLQSQLGLPRCGKPSGRACTVLRSFAPCWDIDSSHQVPRVGDFLGYGDFTLETRRAFREQSWLRPRELKLGSVLKSEPWKRL